MSSDTQTKTDNPERASPAVSVVVTVRNGEGAIRAVLDALAERLRALQARHEVVVVDDGSEDASAQEAARTALDLPEVRVIPMRKRQGPGYAARVGLLAATGDIRVLLPCVEGDSRPAGTWEHAMHRVREGPASLVIGQTTGVMALEAAAVLEHVEAALQHGRTFTPEVVRLSRKAGLTVEEVSAPDPRGHMPGPPFRRVLRAARDLIVEIRWPWAAID